MAKIALTESSFTIIPEGTHIFNIVDVNYKEEFGKMEVKMKTAKGQTHVERFTLMKADGSVNEGAVNAFSFLAKTALQNYSVTEIDHKDIIGRYIKCTVEHDPRPSTKDPSKTVIFVRLGDESPADGFEEATPAKKPAGGSLDLNTLLG